MIRKNNKPTNHMPTYLYGLKELVMLCGKCGSQIIFKKDKNIDWYYLYQPCLNKKCKWSKI